MTLTLRRLSVAIATALGLTITLAAYGKDGINSNVATTLAPRLQNGARTATPIQHLVVIFGENISFDHYFGTYPKAVNPPGQPRFVALPGTPGVNGLTPALLTNNPNLNPANGAGAANPFRLNRNQALTADQNHGDTAEQQSFDN